MSFVKEVTVGSKRKLTAEQRKKASDEIEKARKEASRIVKGVFKNIECQGGDVTFSYLEYKGDPIRTYHLLDGESYDIPLGVAKHINRQCKYKKSKYLVDKDNRPIIGADKSIERYQFVSQDYM